MSRPKEIFFERHHINYVTESSHCFEVTALRSHPPKFFIDKHGYLSYEGDGDFGVVFIDQKFSNFQFDLEVLVPEGDYEYANSGIFFRSKDPRHLDHPGIPMEVVNLAKTRSPGFISNWSSYEVQLLAGSVPGENSLNKSNGAFYDIPVGTQLGSQQCLEYRFHPGETYQVRLVVREQKFEVHMKSAKDKNYLLVSQMTNNDLNRSFRPGYIGLQSYYSNGTSVRAICFSKVSIQEI